MPELKPPSLSKRAERAVARAAKDRNARLAVGVVAGSGVAIAATKAALDRVREDTDGGQPRTYRLRRKESPIAGIRRVAEGRADDALDQLRDGMDHNPGAAVHEARKDLKKLRSVLRLVRHEVGEDLYGRENVRFRDAGRALSGARDALVKLETLAALRERFDERFAKDELALLVHALEAERERLADPAGDALALDRAMGAIAAGRDAIADWPLHGDDWSLIGPGLRRTYRRGRNRLADVRSEANDEAVHEWRKRVKDLWYDGKRAVSLGSAAGTSAALAASLNATSSAVNTSYSVVPLAGRIRLRIVLTLASPTEQRPRLKAATVAIRGAAPRRTLTLT